ncbi:uncharacterized protein JCM15063_002740 [Sporobolomyces koalae]|uniref:uncharacterized protein n=1 Tax=Sporobolomyces koalae TaxID=500713 RepID=UPI00316B7438
MRYYIAGLASVASLSSVVSAAGILGYGRFGCSIINGDGTFSPDQTQCLAANLNAPGANAAGTGIQGDGLTPIDPTCSKEVETGAYFCGIAGATCTSDQNCDNGVCAAGICQGGFLQACAGLDTNCSGFLYCLAGDFTTTPSDSCGAFGAFCQDPTQGSVAFTDAENYAIFNQFCAGGYCNYGTGDCDTHGTTVGADCSSDPEFYCTETAVGQSLVCGPSNTCQLASVPSGRARARRAEIGRRTFF